jgi:hypothetical protein
MSSEASKIKIKGYTVTFVNVGVKCADFLLFKQFSLFGNTPCSYAGPEDGWYNGEKEDQPD